MALALILAMVMIAGTMTIVVNRPQQASQERRNATSLYFTHSPIMIEGDAEFTGANGVTGGDGSEANPYVISNWDIDASTSTVGGIAITNSTSHVDIRNVHVHDGGATRLGIILANVTNATVSNSVLEFNELGIFMIQANGTVVEDNIVQFSDVEGIIGFTSNYTSIRRNVVTNSSGIGIALFDCNSSAVANNSVVSHSTAGIALEFLGNNTVAGNFVKNCSAGIVLVGASKNLVENNYVVDSTLNALTVSFSDNNTVRSNNFADTASGYGAEVTLSADNHFYHNNFLNNMAMSAQAFDDSLSDHWNASYPIGGNHWSDLMALDQFSGPDQNIAGADGIADTPYTLMPIGTNFDYYPLMDPYVNSTAPTAFFVVSPPNGPEATEFVFNASFSWDPDDAPSTLEVRWDFDGDGTFDTSFSTYKNATHTYAAAGDYFAVVEVRDPAGHTDSATVMVQVEGPGLIPEFSITIVVGGMIAFFLVLGIFRKKGLQI